MTISSTSGISNFNLTRLDPAKTQVKNDNTIKDEVLDLSDPKSIVKELKSQDVSFIKAIKIGDELVTASPEDIKNIISGLKSEILAEGKNLKADFKKVNFSDATGISIEKLDPAVVESNAAFDPAASGSNGTIKKNTADKNVMSLTTNNLNGHQGVAHNDAVKYLDGVKTRVIDPQITKIDDAIKKLETLKGTAGEGIKPELGSKINQLKGEKAALTEVKGLIDINKEIHTALAYNTPFQNPTGEQIKKLQDLGVKFSEKLENFNNTLNSDPNLSPEFKANTAGLIDKSAKFVKTVADVTNLAQNTDLLSSMSALGKPTALPNLIVQYEGYLKLAEKGNRSGKGESSDATGFVNACKNDVTYDQVGAKKFDELSQKISSGEIKGDDNIKKAVEDMFKTTSGKFFIKEEKVGQAVVLFQKLGQAVSHQKNISGLQSEVAKLKDDVSTDLQVRVGDAVKKQQELEKSSPIQLKNWGYAPSVNSTTNQISSETSQIVSNTGQKLEKVEAKKNEALEKQTEKFKQEYDEMTKTGKGIGAFIDNHLGYDSKVHFELQLTLEAGGKVGKGKTWETGLTASVSGGIAVTVEKTFSAGYPYKAHIDLKLNADLQAKVGPLFEANFGVEYKTVLAGIGFKSAEDAENIINKVKLAIEEAGKGNDKVADSIMSEVGKDLKKRMYDAETMTGTIKLGFGKEHHGARNVDVEATRSVQFSTEGGKNYQTSTNQFEATHHHYAVLVKHMNTKEVENGDIGKGEQIKIASGLSDQPAVKMKGSDNYPPELNRLLVELKVPSQDVAKLFSYIDKKTGNVTSDGLKYLDKLSGDLAGAVAKFNPELGSKMGVDALKSFIGDQLSNIGHSKTFQKLEPLLKMHGHGHSHVTFGIDTIDDKASGKEKMKFEIGFHGEMTGESHGIPVGGVAKLKMEGKAEVQVVGVLGYKEIGYLEGKNGDTAQVKKYADKAETICNKVLKDDNASPENKGKAEKASADILKAKQMILSDDPQVRQEAIKLAKEAYKLVENIK